MRVASVFTDYLFGFVLALLLAWLLAATAEAATPLSITTKVLPNPTLGTAYTQTLKAAGGKAPYTWLGGTGLPAGLTLDPVTGKITGSPVFTAPDMFSKVYVASFTVRDTNGLTASTNLTLMVLPSVFKLSVVHGTGTGSYPSNTVVAITANPPALGQGFHGWTGAKVENPLAMSTSLVMPTSNTTVTATYTNVKTVKLTVVNGAGSGTFVPGTSTSITANPAPAGQLFKGWTGVVVANSNSPSTTLVLAYSNVTVTANFAVPPPLAITSSNLPGAMVGFSYAQTLTAAGGFPPYSWAAISGSFPDGLNLETNGDIVGSPTPEGDWIYTYPFRAYVMVWDSAGHSNAQAFGLNVLRNTNAPATFALNVINGSGSGSYAANTSVPISASAPPVGMVFQNWTGATVVNPNSASTTLIMPASGTSVTANYVASGGGGGGGGTPGAYALTVVNGSGSGSYAANATIQISANPAPAGQVFQGWTGVAVANPTAPSTTLSMPAGPATVTANFAAQGSNNIAQPVTTHPRLWITPADLPRLQSWASPANPIYQQGLLTLLGTAVANYQQFFPNGQMNPVNPDLGDTQGYQGLLCEQNALIFAFFSLIDPANQALHAQRARDLIMVGLNEAVKGPLSGAPFRDPLFAVYNRANATSEAWPLVVDWIYNATNALGQPILTAQDKATVRDVFLIWAKQCLSASTTGGDSPQVHGVMNDPQLLPGGNAYRMAANNYYLGHARLLTLMSLALDPADDPAVTPGVPLSVLGNSLRSYIANATGAWLYQEFAMFGDPAVVQAAYGLPPTAAVGIASGGLPPEGMLYGHSFSFILGQVLALKTAGYADPTLAGPQVALANNAPIWDRFVKGFISSLVPAQQVPPSATYLGPVYQFASYGDILRMFATPDMMGPYALLSLLDRQNGDLSRLNAESWFTINAVEGGAAGLIGRVQQPWSYGVQDALLTFLTLDPNVTVTDPRPAYSTAFYDATQGRLLDRTDWTPAASLFDFRCSWNSINHQQADGNQFEFYRKGEWLTKGVANYDNNALGLTTDYHNTLSLQNWCQAGIPANLGWWEAPFWANGSQWQLGGAAGDPTVLASSTATYTYAYGDATKLYNRPSFWSPANAALDIQHASRSIIWLKPDYIVIYDRATSHTAGLFKHFNLALTAAPSINGNLITTTTPGGQHLFITSLLPANGTVSTLTVGSELNPIAELEPSNHRIIIQDPSLPSDARFLTVLQGADSGTPADASFKFQSTAGTLMDGAVIGSAAVLFSYDATVGFIGTTYQVPVGVHQHFVTGCSPGSLYSVNASTSGGMINVTVTPAGSGIQADVAGVLAFTY